MNNHIFEERYSEDIQQSSLEAQMPPYLTGEELIKELAVLPPHLENATEMDEESRYLAIQELYRVYIPTEMAREIYGKFYFALRNALRKKESRDVMKQTYSNFRSVRGETCQGIIGGSDSFSVIGPSGIGKTAAVSRAVTLVGGNRIMTGHNPFCKVIPVLLVQTPFDCSPKGMLMQILLAADEWLGTQYYQNALRARATQDMLIGNVSQICLNHVGLLVVDEIQNVVGNRSGNSLVGMLTQLVNSSGISICFVGTPEVAVFFEQTDYLARRTIGLHYGLLDYGEEFCYICRELMKYQCVPFEYLETEAVIRSLFEFSNGNLSIVVALLHDAQERAVLTGRDSLDNRCLEEVWERRMGTLHHLRIGDYRTPPSRTKKIVRLEVPEKRPEREEGKSRSDVRIEELLSEIRGNDRDVGDCLREKDLLAMEVVV